MSTLKLSFEWYISCTIMTSVITQINITHNRMQVFPWKGSSCDSCLVLFVAGLPTPAWPNSGLVDLIRNCLRFKQCKFWGELIGWRVCSLQMCNLSISTAWSNVILIWVETSKATWRRAAMQFIRHRGFNILNFAGGIEISKEVDAFMGTSCRVEVTTRPYSSSWRMVQLVL